MEKEYQDLVLRALSLLMSRLSYAGDAQIERKKDKWQKDAFDFIARWHLEGENK